MSNSFEWPLKSALEPSSDASYFYYAIKESRKIQDLLVLRDKFHRNNSEILVWRYITWFGFLNMFRFFTGQSVLWTATIRTDLQYFYRTCPTVRCVLERLSCQICGVVINNDFDWRWLKQVLSQRIYWVKECWLSHLMYIKSVMKIDDTGQQCWVRLTC